MLAALRWRVRPVVLTVGALVLAVIAVGLASPGALGLEGRSFDAIDKATSGRAELVKGGARMFADRPVYGFGSGAFAERYRDRENLLSERSPAESHTIPITVAAEQGVVGLAAYLILVVTALSLVLRGRGALAAPARRSRRRSARCSCTRWSTPRSSRTR